MKKVIVEISAQEHSGKTNLAALIAKILQESGISVNLPVDTQRDEKMAMSIDELKKKLKDDGVEVQFMEMNTARLRHE
jgi:hypothetical protein